MRHSALRTPHSALGQSVIEYSVLIAVALAALLSLSIYTRRALSGRWKGIADGFGHGRQFEPGVTVVTTSD